MITLYSNEWETANLLGTSKLKHKLAAFYRTPDTYYHTAWDFKKQKLAAFYLTLVNMSPMYKSKLNYIQ